METSNGSDSLYDFFGYVHVQVVFKLVDLLVVLENGISKRRLIHVDGHPQPSFGSYILFQTRRLPSGWKS